MPGKGTATLMIVVSPTGQIIKMEIVESLTGLTAKTGDMWLQTKAFVNDQIAHGETVIAMRYNNVTARDVVYITWHWTPDQRREKSDNIYPAGSFEEMDPEDPIGLIEMLRRDIRAEKPPAGLPEGTIQAPKSPIDFAMTLLAQHSDNPIAITSSLLAARNAGGGDDDTELSRRAYEVVCVLHVISQDDNRREVATIAGVIYHRYHTILRRASGENEDRPQ